MRMTAVLAFLCALVLPAAAAGPEASLSSRCMAIAQALPGVVLAAYTPAQAQEGPVRITYAGHSTYVIETPAGVRIATDFNGYNGASRLPRVVTMNKAHSSHYTDSPDPAIEHVLRGWNPEGGPARHLLRVDDVLIRNVPTDIRTWNGMEADGNSIFVFEVAGLCIGHLGHLHHDLTDAHYAAIGRLDIVMVPIDGGMTQSLANMSEIATRLFSSIVLPMHRLGTPLQDFVRRVGSQFEVEIKAGRSFSVSLETLPKTPTVVILEGV